MSDVADIKGRLLDKYETIIGESDNLSIEEIVESIVHYHEDIISCMPGNVYWFDKNAMALGCNQNVLEMFGLKSMAEFKGMTFEQMRKIRNWSNETSKSFEVDTLDVIQTGKPKLNIDEPPIRHSDGREIHFLSSRVPLFDQKNSVIGMVGVSIDITERKKMEFALNAANDAKTIFLENMRHDIRTPLSGIVGFASLLNGETDKEKINEYTQLLSVSSNELLRFLDEILDSINIASGEIPLLRKRFDLKEVLDNVIKLHQSKALEKRLALEFYLDNAIPRYLIGDPTRIYRIILEFLSNALKFTEQGKVQVSATLAQKKERDLVIKIEIEDTGPGIPKDKQQDLFARFKRLSPSYQGIHKGSGLGLSIAKQFIDDLEGEVYVDSEPGQYTRFICLIPLKEALLIEDPLSRDRPDRAIHPSPAKTPSEATQNFSSNKPISVLLVEDQFIAAKAVESILVKLGCTVKVASEGKTSVTLAKEYPYDLILMDLGLPDMMGDEATQQIRSCEQSLGRSSVIVGLTGHVDTAKKQSYLDKGMNAVLNKPLTPAIARTLLNEYFPNKILEPC